MTLIAPGFSISDNADGSGATATISGGDPSAFNSVLVQPVDESHDAAAWISVASRIGPGTISLPVAAGFYWGRCDAVLGAESTVAPLVYFQATAAATPLHYRCLSAVLARIHALALTGIENEQIVLRKYPRLRRGDGLPRIVVSPQGDLRSDTEAGTNLRDQVEYPVSVTILAADDQTPAAAMADSLGSPLRWREQIAAAFRGRPLAGVPEIWNCDLLPSPAVDPSLAASGLLASSLLLSFVSRQQRGE